LNELTDKPSAAAHLVGLGVAEVKRFLATHLFLNSAPP
jgi:hypothetical protein